MKKGVIIYSVSAYNLALKLDLNDVLNIDYLGILFCRYIKVRKRCGTIKLFE